MKYWLICLPRADMQRCIDKQTFGLSRKNIIGQVQEGDKLICCAGKGDWKTIASGVATSNYYLDIEPIFLEKKDIYADRFNFKAIPLPVEQSIVDMLDKLSFVTNIAYWAVFFRNGIVKISENDWNLLNGSD